MRRCIRMVSSAIIVTSACCALLLLIWNLDRGLDITDESILLYFYRHPDAFLDRIYQHHFRLVRALVPSSLDHVYYYRLLKLLSLVAFTSIFSAIFAIWTTRRFNFLAGYSLDPITLFFFLLTGSLLSYCHGSQTLSYNDLVTVSLLAVATAGFLLDLSPSRISSDVWRFLISFLVGGILLMTFFVKWPSAVLLAVYYWLFSGLIGCDRQPRALLVSFAGTIWGAVLAGFVTTDVGAGRVFSFARLYEALSNPLNLGPHRDTFGLLAMYVESSVSRLVALLQSPSALAVLALPVAAIVASAYLHNGRTRRIVLGGGLGRHPCGLGRVCKRPAELGDAPPSMVSSLPRCRPAGIRLRRGVDRSVGLLARHDQRHTAERPDHSHCGDSAGGQSIGGGIDRHQQCAVDPIHPPYGTTVRRPGHHRCITGARRSVATFRLRRVCRDCRPDRGPTRLRCSPSSLSPGEAGRRADGRADRTVASGGP
jgi:hypothetical protein